MDTLFRVNDVIIIPLNDSIKTICELSMLWHTVSMYRWGPTSAIGVHWSVGQEFVLKFDCFGVHVVMLLVPFSRLLW